MYFALIKVVPRGIGLRFSLWFAVLFTVFSLACLVLAYIFVAKSLRERDQLIVIEKQRELAALVRGRDISDLVQKIRTEANGDEAEFFVRVSDVDGSQLYIDATFDDLEEFSKIPAPGSAGVPKGDGLWNEILSDEADEFLELYSAKLPFGGWLEVGHSSEHREDILTGFRDQLPWIAASLLVGGLCCGVFFSNRALRPIRELINTVSKINAGNISARVNSGSSGDELDTLKNLFNEMLDQVQTLIEGMRQTTDGLAHDIKTPITRLRANAELALGELVSKEQMHDALVTTIENSEQIISLIDSLMDVSEAEAGSMQLNFRTVDMDDVIQNVLDLYEFSAMEKEIKLTYEKSLGLGPMYIEGDIIQLRRALANLIDNAIKYSDLGGRVTISTLLTPEFLTIAVADSGKGISEQELPHIWTRLFRGDQSRSEKGMGLGLSLVKAIAEVHGGSVAVKSTIGKGSTFTLKFKRRKESAQPV